MVQFLPLLAPVVVFSLLIALSHCWLKPHAPDEKVWYLFVRALLPIASLVLTNAMYFAGSIFYPNKITGEPVYEVVCLLCGFGACVLLTIDLIRCRSRFMKALGIVYLALGIGLFLVALASVV